MRASFTSLMLLLGLTAACAGRPDVWPDNSQRIEEAMERPAPGEPLPEGIALGADAAQLAFPETEGQVRQVPPEEEAVGTSWGHERWLLPVPVPAQPERQRGHLRKKAPSPSGTREPPIKKRHLGSTPGLLP